MENANPSEKKLYERPEFLNGTQIERKRMLEIIKNQINITESYIRDLKTDNSDFAYESQEQSDTLKLELNDLKNEYDLSVKAHEKINFIDVFDDNKHNEPLIGQELADFEEELLNEKYGFGQRWENIDSDGDGITNGQEVQLGTNPYSIDTDADGISDSQEISNGTNPTLPDSFLESAHQRLSEDKEILNAIERPSDGLFGPKWDDEAEDHYQDFKKMVELKEIFLENPAYYQGFLKTENSLELSQNMQYLSTKDFKINASDIPGLLKQFSELEKGLRIALVTNRDLGTLDINQQKKLRGLLFQTNDINQTLKNIKEKNLSPEGTNFRIKPIQKNGETIFQIQKKHSVLGWQNIPNKDFSTTSKDFDQIKNSYDKLQSLSINKSSNLKL